MVDYAKTMELIDPWLLVVISSDPSKKMKAEQIVSYVKTKKLIDPWQLVVMSTNPLKKIKAKKWSSMQRPWN